MLLNYEYPNISFCTYDLNGHLSSQKLRSYGQLFVQVLLNLRV